MLNNNGPRTDPCGTPHFNVLHVLYEPFTLVLCFLSFKKLYINLRAQILKPYASYLTSNKSRFKQSNALDKSVNTAPPLFFWSSAFISIIIIKHCSVLYPFLYPKR